MNPMLSAWLGAALRALLGPLLTWIALRIGMDEGDATIATLALSGVVLNMLWVLWVKYKDRLKFLAALEAPVGTSEDQLRSRMKLDPPKVIGLLLAAVLLTPACAARSAPVLVAQGALGLAQTVGQMQEAAIGLQRAEVLSVSSAIRVQERLLKVNEEIRDLVPLLRTVDRLQQAGVAPSKVEIDALITQVFLALQELTVVSADVPIADASKAFLDLLRTTQQTMTTTMIELARIRVALEG